MSRSDQRAETERTVDRVAHAFTPAEWSGRWLVAGIAVFVIVAATTVVQRAIVADGAREWTITVIHGLIVALVVPALTIRAVRQWRAVQATIAVPE